MKHASQDGSTNTLAALIAVIVLALTFLGSKALGGQAPAERGALYLVRGRDTIVADRFRRTGDALEGSMQVKGQPRFDYLVTLGTGDAVRTLVLGVFAAGAAADAAPVQRLRVIMRGDTALVETPAGVSHVGTRTGAIPMFNNALALTELFTRRARASGGAAEIPFLALSGGATLTLAVQPAGPDSLVVTVAGQEQRLRVDATGRITGGSLPAAGLEFVRAGPEAAADLKVTVSDSPVAPKADYSAPDGAPYVAEEVTITGPKGIRLGGTLTRPTNAVGASPAVVTITGSGQQDRDEYIPYAGGIRLFRQVADTLGRRGIAVLRIDDRGIGASGGDPQNSTSADFADDIRAALAFLRARADIDASRLALVGHSEGGLIAPMIAATDPQLKAIVSLAGPAYTGLDIVRYQQRFAIDHDPGVKPERRDSAYRAAREALDQTAAQKPWLAFFLSHDPLATARKVQAAALILQGETDRQITAEQAEKLGAAMRAGGNRDVTVRVFPQLNHLFIHDPDGNASGYDRLPTNKVDAAVLGAVADWLADRLAVGRKP